MFIQKDLNKEVKIRQPDGDLIRGIVTAVGPESVWVLQNGATEPQEVHYNTISTVTRVGEFGGD